MHALVVGGDGKLGRALCTELLARGHVVTRTTRRPWMWNMTSSSVMAGMGRSLERPARQGEDVLPLDMRDPHLPYFCDEGDLIVYVMAAIPGFVPASSNPDAWRVNAEAPVLLALQARERGWHAVHMSSGAVERAQETAYGRQKAHADLGVLLLGGSVVRPMPAVSPERYSELSGLLIDVGEARRAGVIRWE